MHIAELMLHINSLDAADILGYNTQKINILRLTGTCSAYSAYQNILGILTHTQNTTYIDAYSAY